MRARPRRRAGNGPRCRVARRGARRRRGSRRRRRRRDRRWRRRRLVSWGGPRRRQCGPCRRCRRWPPSIIAGDDTDIAERVARARAGDADRADLVSIVFVIDRKARARRQRDLAAKLFFVSERVELPELRRCGLVCAISDFFGSEDKAAFLRCEAHTRREASRQCQRAVESVHRARVGLVFAVSKYITDVTRVEAGCPQEYRPAPGFTSNLRPTRHLDGVV